MKKILFLIPFLVLISIFGWNSREHIKLEDGKAASISDSISKYNLDKKLVKIWVKKSDYTLKLLIDGKLVKTYPVVFGADPVNDKLKQGDGCTPEGIYHIRAKYPHKSWTYF
jgi:murein L,D-transpeptidase YafK